MLSWPRSKLNSQGPICLISRADSARVVCLCTRQSRFPDHSELFTPNSLEMGSTIRTKITLHKRKQEARTISVYWQQYSHNKTVILAKTIAVLRSRGHSVQSLLQEPKKALKLSLIAGSRSQVTRHRVLQCMAATSTSVFKVQLLHLTLKKLADQSETPKDATTASISLPLQFKAVMAVQTVLSTSLDCKAESSLGCLYDQPLIKSYCRCDAVATVQCPCPSPAW